MIRKLIGFAKVIKVDVLFWGLDKEDLGSTE